jgi:hypothetical protein
MKHLLIFVGMIFLVTPFAVADEFDFNDFGDAEFETSDDYTIETNNDMTKLGCDMTNVAINPGASPVAVGNFDILGIMLGMNFDEVQMVVRENGLYTNRPKDAVVYSMHPDWKYSLDYECRQQNIVIPKRLDQCINSLARNRGVLYASELHLVRSSTGETIDVYFTSNATDNVVWKIVYKNDVDEIEGDAEKFANQRDKKIMSWWQNVIEKYGAPNADSDKWASSDNAYDPMMTAYYGELELTDCGRNAEDSSLNIEQSQENFAVKPYAF